MATVNSQQAEPPLIVSIDIGTSSIRVALFDRLGRALQGLEARRNHEFRTDAQGMSEADPDFLLDLIFQCLDQVLARIEKISSPIGGVAVCSFVNNILGLDRKLPRRNPADHLCRHPFGRGGSRVKNGFRRGEDP